MRTAIRKSTRKQFDRELLSDQHIRDLKPRIEEKLNTGTDVLKAPEEPEPAEAESNVIDLMQVLKERLQGRRSQPSKPEAAAHQRQPHKRRPALESLNKHELYDKAKQLEITGRRKMSREQLIEAITRSRVKV